MSIKGIASLADLMEDLPAAGPQEVALSLIDPDPHQPRTSFDDLRLDSVAPEDVLETLHHRGGTSAGGTGDRDDRVFSGQRSSPSMTWCA